MATAPRTVEPRLQGDGGAVIVEAALALPILAVLALGLMEFGFAFNESIILDRGINIAGRTLSNSGDERLADYNMLRALDSSIGGLKRSTVKRVIVYESNTATDEGAVPASCLAISATGTNAKGVTNLCNVYSPQQANVLSPYGFAPINGTSCAAGAWDSYYCPTQDRSRDVPDHVGLYVEITYDTLTGVIGGNDTITIQRQVVYAVEPESVGG